MPVINYLLLLGSYLLGSIPTSVWIGKVFYNTDIREHGSGNAGANNTFRVLGAKAGVPVLIIDILKGFASVKLILLNQYFESDTLNHDIFMLSLGFLAVVGHIFPVFARFNGGKGVATMLGITLAFQFYPALAALGVFALVVLLFKYVSLGSIIASITFPLLTLFVFHIESSAFAIYSVVLAIVIVLTHLRNIERLFNGEESRIHINGTTKKN
ncbi:MAG: glycerol-3-phosphate 1-O-acyltransferase PlsY [Bacteroidales bacterium]|nr:glycerol-3-phosphate 1-O-acyltransferase PlsY [Bacteroidales bacterium]